MSALMDLASFNISGAVSNGYKAYGEYRLSEDLDYNADMAKLNRLKMADARDPNTLKELASFRPTNTTFSRLDGSHLRQGQAAEVAAEFERRSGMSREEFHRFMGKISDAKISANDPQMMDRVLSRFESFAARIPNDEFRGNIQKAIAMVPQSARTGIIAKALSQVGGMFAGGDGGAGASGPSDVAAPVAGVIGASKGEGSGLQSSSNRVDAEVEGGRQLASSGDASLKGQPKAMNLSGVGREPNSPLWNIMEKALADGQSDVTIFQQISRKYGEIGKKLVSQVTR